MASRADATDEFDVYTVVVLRRPAEPPELTDAELGDLHRQLAGD